MSGRQKIVITGAKGKVGTALTKGLGQEYDIVPVDLPDLDIFDKDNLEQAMEGADAVIHLAGIFRPVENWQLPGINPDNFKMAKIALETARRAGVPQFILASSIHAEDSVGYMSNGHGMLKPSKDGYKTKKPTSGYGLNKRRQERLVKSMASDFPNGTVAIRLGGVNRENKVPDNHDDPLVLEHEKRVWLDHADLVGLVKKILGNPQPRKYSVVYAVSNNPGKFHDTVNPFGWKPANH